MCKQIIRKKWVRCIKCQTGIITYGSEGGYPDPSHTRKYPWGIFPDGCEVYRFLSTTMTVISRSSINFSSSSFIEDILANVKHRSSDLMLELSRICRCAQYQRFCDTSSSDRLKVNVELDVGNTFHSLSSVFRITANELDFKPVNWTSLFHIYGYYGIKKGLTTI